MSAALSLLCGCALADPHTPPVAMCAEMARLDAEYRIDPMRTASSVVPRIDRRLNSDTPGGPVGSWAAQLCRWHLEYWREAVVEIDEYLGPYPCYLTGGTWNGFATPHFRREVADAICARIRESAPGSIAEYDPGIDGYRIFVPDLGPGPDEPLVEGDERIEEFRSLNPFGVVLYPIGAWSWTWSEVVS